MKRIITLILAACIMTMSLVACGSDNKCDVCRGSGYYQKKDCPFCVGGRG